VKTKKKIWIDFENTPHVLFFKPIIQKLNERGYIVIVTARDYAQVYSLANLFGIDYTKIGHHFGKNKFHKLIGLIIRMLQLYIYIWKENPDLALNHGSRSQILASKLLGINCLTAIDYEHTQTLPFVSPTLTIMPKVLYNSYKNYSSTKISWYPGIKEDVYVQSYVPNSNFKKDLCINNGNIIVTIRPPATEAHYHKEKSEDLFKNVIDYICNKNNTCTILLPRTKSQDDLIRKLWPSFIKNRSIIIPERAINGLDLIWYSDLVISGGGTMIREAASLNVPAYSFFQGRIGAIDRYLEEIGKLILIKNSMDVQKKIILKHRNRPIIPEYHGKSTIESIIDTINSMAPTQSFEK
jgi:uncharacterized protein